ncbi:MAG: hypothetical protein N3D71_01175 [Burkholderiaceae bacterium]|nr:hypothetical protein [Burkholderiaceae bacterium]
MGSATGRDLHVDNLLSQVAINYRPSGMIGDQIFPIVPVQKETDSYPVFNRGEVFAIEKTLRTRTAEAMRVTRSVSSAQYACKNYALAYDMPIEDRANMDAAFQFELEAGRVRYLTDKLMLDMDRRILQTARTNVATTFLCGSSWAAPGASAGDPFSQIVQAIEQVKGTTAERPNSIIFGWRAYQWARRNLNMRNLINGTNNGRGIVSRQQIQEALEVDRLLVAEAFFNPSNEAQTATFSTVFPADAVLVYYAPLAPSRETPSFGYSFRWTSPELGTPFAAIRHPFESRTRVDGIEVQYYQDERVTGSDYGVLIAGVGSAQATGLV